MIAVEGGLGDGVGVAGLVRAEDDDGAPRTAGVNQGPFGGIVGEGRARDGQAAVRARTGAVGHVHVDGPPLARNTKGGVVAEGGIRHRQIAGYVHDRAAGEGGVGVPGDEAVVDGEHAVPGRGIGVAPREGRRIGAAGEFKVLQSQRLGRSVEGAAVTKRHFDDVAAGGGGGG